VHDAFILHADCGTQDHVGRLSQERVSALGSYLRDRGLRTWFEYERVHGPVLDTTCSAIDDSEVVLVLVTQAALDRVAGSNGPSDTFKKLFECASRSRLTYDLGEVDL
jgi:hypothetical protein